MSKYPMIDFYAESREGTVEASTQALIVEKLNYVFDNLTANYGVIMEERQIRNLNGEVLQRWMNWMKKSRKETTVNNYICMLNPFLRWAHIMTSGDDDDPVPYLKNDLSGVLHTLRLPDPDKIPEEERPKSKYYSREEIEAMMECPGSHNKTRDRAMMAMFLGTGLRVSELCSLTIGDFRKDHGTIYVKRKGGAWKHAEVADFVYDYVNSYLTTRKDGEDAKAPLFVTQYGEPCNRVQVYKSFANIQKKLDIAKGAHALRHTFISEVEKTGGGAVARDLANHKSLTITNRYDHSTSEQREKAVNQLSYIKKL